MNIVIIDDDKKFAEILKKDFVEYFKDFLEEINITCIFKCFEQYTPSKLDIAFIDIELKECTGFCVAEKLREKFPNLIIIFVSCHDGLVCKTLRYGVLQFIRKLYYREDSIFTFRQLKEYMEREMKKAIIIIQGRHILIEAKEVKYLLSIGHEVSIHTDKDEYIIKSSMQGVLDMLGFRTLIKIKKNVVINMTGIRRFIGDEIIMLDGQRWKVGRVYKKVVIEKYHNYQFEVFK